MPEVVANCGSYGVPVPRANQLLSISVKCHPGMPCQSPTSRSRTVAVLRPVNPGIDLLASTAKLVCHVTEARAWKKSANFLLHSTRQDSLRMEVGREARNGNYQLVLDRLSEDSSDTLTFGSRIIYSQYHRPPTYLNTPSSLSTQVFSLPGSCLQRDRFSVET